MSFRYRPLPGLYPSQCFSDQLFVVNGGVCKIRNCASELIDATNNRNDQVKMKINKYKIFTANVNWAVCDYDCLYFRDW